MTHMPMMMARELSSKMVYEMRMARFRLQFFFYTSAIYCGVGSSMDLNSSAVAVRAYLRLNWMRTTTRMIVKPKNWTHMNHLL